MKNFIITFLLFILSFISYGQHLETIKYGNILEFGIPDKYELRTNAYINEVKNEVLKELDFKSSVSQYVLQPKGMNETNGKSNLYSRILIKVEKGNFESNQKLIKHTKSELEELESYIKSEISKVPYIQIIKTTPVSILILKSKGFIDFSYISKDDEGNIVTRMLTFSDINYRIRISIIYRESEKNYWENSIKDFLNSINIK
jgi:hypothetical protein